jgi:hypothetical protein
VWRDISCKRRCSLAVTVVCARSASRSAPLDSVACVPVYFHVCIRVVVRNKAKIQVFVRRGVRWRENFIYAVSFVFFRSVPTFVSPESCPACVAGRAAQRVSPEAAPTKFLQLLIKDSPKYC